MTRCEGDCCKGWIIFCVYFMLRVLSSYLCFLESWNVDLRALFSVISMHMTPRQGSLGFGDMMDQAFSYL